jgi:hypothetical protein
MWRSAIQDMLRRGFAERGFAVLRLPEFLEYFQEAPG